MLERDWAAQADPEQLEEELGVGEMVASHSLAVPEIPWPAEMSRGQKQRRLRVDGCEGPTLSYQAHSCHPHGCTSALLRGSP